MLNSHIREGRENLNFSEYGNYKRDESIRMLGEIRNVIENNEMPPGIYTLFHKDARITKDMKEMIISWLTEGKNDIQQP